MKPKPIPLVVAIATALLLHAAPTAAALGEIVSLSAIGEPFRAEIRVTAGGIDDAANCLRIVVPDDGSRDLPWLKNGRISGTGSGASARIVVSGSQPINEPALKLAIANICDAQLRKEYTLLLPYPVAGASLAAPRTLAPARQERSEPRAAAPRTAAAGARTWTTAPGESLATLADALYPDDPAARRRFMRATAAANPELFPDAASRTATLRHGTAVVIPDLRRAVAPRTAPLRDASTPPRAESRPTAQKPPPPVAVAAPSMQPATSSASDRLLVADETASAGRSSAATGASGVSATPRTVDASWSARERELAAAVDRSIIAERELNSRITELEQLQARLEKQAQALGIVRPAAVIPAPDATSAPPPAPKPAPEPAPAAPESKEAHDWYLTGGLLFAILLILAALLRRRRGESRDALRARPDMAARRASGPSRPAAAAVDKPRVSTISALEQDTLPHHGGAQIAWDAAGTRRETAEAVASGSGDEPAEEHKSAVELAEIMMSFGRIQGAAETLADFIHSNPKQAITPWLKLLDVYRAAGLRAEFEGLSRQLHKTFNVKTVSWDTYDSLRNTPLSLEDLPHITSRLQTLWGTRECQAYIQQLLRDNRDGSREGFPFAVIDELLALEGVLEQNLGSYKTYAMKLSESAR